MDVQKTIEFLLGTQARHDGQIAEIREAQKLAQEAQKASHALHAAEMAEIRELLGQTVKLVAGLAQVVDQHRGRIQALEGGPA